MILRWALLATLSSALAGCSEYAHSEYAHVEEPDSICFEYEVQSIASNGCAYPEEECEPFVIGMCKLTRNSGSMFLGRLVDYEIGPDPGCEERLYRTHHGIATFVIIDHIAGEDLGQVVDVIDTSNFHYVQPIGDDFIVYAIPFEDEYLLTPSVKEVTLNRSDDCPEVTGSDELPVVYDVPRDYDDFASEAADHWNNFEAQCPDMERFQPHIDDEEGFIEYMYERPSYCTDDGGDEEVNYNNAEDEQTNAPNSGD